MTAKLPPAPIEPHQLQDLQASPTVCCLGAESVSSLTLSAWLATRAVTPAVQSLKGHSVGCNASRMEVCAVTER